MLAAASFYSPHALESEIMADLRHFRFPINLIDFTRDIRVALFFACLGNPRRPGKIFFLRFESRKPGFDGSFDQPALYDWLQAIDTEIFQNFHISSNAKRAIRQSSVLVHSPSGHLDFEKEETYHISAARKRDILEYLTRPDSSIESQHLFPDKVDFLNLGLEVPGPRKDFEKKLEERLKYRSKKLQGGDHYDKGRDCFFHGLYEDAVGYFRTAYQKPDKIQDINFHRFLSSALLRTKRQKDTLVALERIPRHLWEGQDYYMSALSNQELGKLQGALDDINMAIAVNPLRSIYYITRLLVIQQIGGEQALSDAIQRYQTLFHSKRGEDSPLGQD